MITTGIPYKMKEMQDIQDNGAIVDMSSIEFPNVPDDHKRRTVLIFLRNTGFNVTLDFSNCSFDEKSEFLKLYMTEELKLSNPEFHSTWFMILGYAIGINFGVNSVLNEEEIKDFIKENNDLITNIFQFIVSFPIYALYRFHLVDRAYDLSTLPTTDDYIIKSNVYNLIKYEDFLLLYDAADRVSPVFYNKVFTLDNNELFDAISPLPFFTILYGMSTINEDELKNMMTMLTSESNEGDINE